MGRKKNLIKNTFILSLGTFFPGFVTVLVTPILTAQLTKAEYGEYDLITTIVSLLLPAVTLQISAASFRFLIDTREDEQKSSEIITSIYVFVLLVTFITSVFFYVFGTSKLGHKSLLICLYFFTDIIFLTTAQMVRGLGKNLLYSLSSIIKAFVNVILIAIFVGCFGTKNLGIVGVLIAMIVSTIIPTVFLLLFGGLHKYIRFSYFSVACLKRCINYSWPMVPNNLSGWVLKLSDRLVITAVCGIEVNAIYAVACRLPTILNYFQSTFMQAWQENAALALKDEDKDTYYSQMCEWIYRLLIGFMCILICLTPIIWKLLVHGDYEEAYYQLPILYLGVLFSCMASIIGAIYTAHMKSKSVGITTSIAAVINLIVDLCFVHFIGIWAGSISTLISYLFLLLYRMKDIQKIQKISFNYKMMSIGITFVIVMGGLCFQRNTYCDLINIPLCIAAILYLDYSIFKSFYKLVVSKVKKRNSV